MCDWGACEQNHVRLVLCSQTSHCRLFWPSTAHLDRKRPSDVQSDQSQLVLVQLWFWVFCFELKCFIMWRCFCTDSIIYFLTTWFKSNFFLEFLMQMLWIISYYALCLIWFTNRKKVNKVIKKFYIHFKKTFLL